MKNKLLAVILLIAIIIASIPTSAFAEDYGVIGYGTGSGSASLGGGGTYSYTQVGLRMYLANKQGEQKSNSVDFVWSNIPSGGKRFVATKLDDGLKASHKTVVYINSYLKTNTPIVPPVTSSNSGNGDALYDWIMKGTPQNGKIQTTSKPVPAIKDYDISSTVTSRKKNDEVKNNADIYSMLLARATERVEACYSMNDPNHNMSQFSAKAASGEVLNTIYNIVADILASGKMGKKQEQVYKAQVLRVYDEIVKMVNNKPVADGSSYGWKSSKAMNNSTLSAGVESKGLYLTAKAATSNNTTTKNIEDTNIGKLLAMTDSKGNFIFQLDKDIEKEYGTKGYDILTTMANNKLLLMIEPLVWFVPSHWTRPPRSECGGHGFWFYGTPTNYARWVKSGAYNEKYCSKHSGAEWTESNYKETIGNLFATCLKLPASGFAFDTFKMAGPTALNIEGDYLNKIADKKQGYAIQIYELDNILPPEEEGLPEIHTGSTTPNLPDQDPDPKKGEIPLEGAEPKQPGTPLTKEQWESGTEIPKEDKGYLNTTRTVNIVKVYQQEDKYGNLNHVSTFVQNNCPGTIIIEDEAEYKVAEYVHHLRQCGGYFFWKTVDVF